MKTSLKAGRPAEFDKDHALDVAMHLFWERGYEGTSMADLSQKMGIHPSSIYAAFGDKQALFALAAKRYADVPAQYMVRALEQPTFRSFVLATFDNTVEFLGSKEHPSSCFTLTGAISCGADTETAKILMREMHCKTRPPSKPVSSRREKLGSFRRKRMWTTLLDISLRSSAVSPFRPQMEQREPS